jgi:2,3-dimethylmalate lyase
MSVCRVFRDLVAADEITVMPGVLDPLSAKVAEDHGFDALYISGFAVSATMGIPDVGLITLTEIIEKASSIVDAVSVPVFMDADTGYGNYLNVMRTVREAERVGLAGLNIEDAVTPHNSTGRPMVTQEEMVKKIEAAVEARQDPDFFIMVRTDAGPTLGVEEAIQRANAYAEAGADAVLLLDVGDVDDMRRANEAVSAPSFGVLSNPHPPLLTASQLQELGFSVVLVSVPPLFAVVKTLSELFTELREHGSIEAFKDRMVDTKYITDLIGLPGVRELEAKYLGIESGWTPW